MYAVDMTVPQMRAAISQSLRANMDENSLVVDMLVSKGEMELEETLLLYKTKTHVMRVLDPAPVSECLSSRYQPVLQNEAVLDGHHVHTIILENFTFFSPLL